jgi:hypothetical protein
MCRLSNTRMPDTPLVTGHVQGGHGLTHHRPAQDDLPLGDVRGAGPLQHGTHGGAEGHPVVAGLLDAGAGDGDHPFGEALAGGQDLPQLGQGAHVVHHYADVHGQLARRHFHPQQGLDEHLLGALGVLGLDRLHGDAAVGGQALADGFHGIQLVVLHADDGALGADGAHGQAGAHHQVVRVLPA